MKKSSGVLVVGAMQRHFWRTSVLASAIAAAACGSEAYEVTEEPTAVATAALTPANSPIFSGSQSFTGATPAGPYSAQPGFTVGLPAGKQLPIGSSRRTVSLWFQESANLQAQTTPYKAQELFSYGDNCDSPCVGISTGHRFGVAIGWGTDYGYTLTLEAGGIGAVFPWASPDTNWHHLVVVYPGGGVATASMYLDNVKLTRPDTINQNQTVLPSPPLSTNPLDTLNTTITRQGDPPYGGSAGGTLPAIGELNCYLEGGSGGGGSCIRTTDNAYAFSGQMADVRIYNDDESAHVPAIFHNGTPTVDPTLDPSAQSGSLVGQWLLTSSESTFQANAAAAAAAAAADEARAANSCAPTDFACISDPNHVPKTTVPVFRWVQNIQSTTPDHLYSLMNCAINTTGCTPTTPGATFPPNYSVLPPLYANYRAEQIEAYDTVIQGTPHTADIHHCYNSSIPDSFYTISHVTTPYATDGCPHPWMPLASYDQNSANLEPLTYVYQSTTPSYVYDGQVQSIHLGKRIGAYGEILGDRFLCELHTFVNPNTGHHYNVLGNRLNANGSANPSYFLFQRDLSGSTFAAEGWTDGGAYVGYGLLGYAFPAMSAAACP